MATEVDLQRLVVQMEASFTKYQREWQKALGTTDANVKQVKQKFDGMTASINNAGARASTALSPLSGQVGNLSAQFQDIGVQLAGGQSPFLIAIQQGTQLSAVLNQAKSPIAALGAAFMQMVNPISLATVGAIALGGAAAQYLGTLLGDGKSATEVIKEQNDVIRRVAENWGDAVPELKAYVDQLDRASQQQDTEQAYDDLVSQKFSQARTELEDIRVGFADARIALQQFGASAQEIDALQQAFDALRAKVAATEDPTRELETLQRLLAETVGVETTPALLGLQVVLDTLSAALATAAAETANLRAEEARLREANAQVDSFTANREFVAEQQRINNLTAEQLDLENEIARVRSEAERADTLISDQQALEIAQGRLAAEERRSQLASSGKAAGRATTDAERERQAVLDLIQELEHEYSLLSMTAEQKAIANALRRAGAAATDEERAAISELISATEEERSRIQGVQDAYTEMGQTAEGAVRGIVNALADGKIEASELGDILRNIGSQLINAGISSLFGNGGLFNFGGKRAAGGPVRSGRTYLVGEKGPELFTPPMSGRIVANDQLGGGGGSFTFAPVIDARGADTAAVSRLTEELTKQRVEFEGRVKQIVRGRGTKWK